MVEINPDQLATIENIARIRRSVIIAKEDLPENRILLTISKN